MGVTQDGGWVVKESYAKRDINQTTTAGWWVWWPPVARSPAFQGAFPARFTAPSAPIGSRVGGFLASLLRYLFTGGDRGICGRSGNSYPRAARPRTRSVRFGGDRRLFVDSASHIAKVYESVRYSTLRRRCNAHALLDIQYGVCAFHRRQSVE